MYIDDSGSVTDKKCNHCVLAGFAVYETKPYWIEQALNGIIDEYLPAYPDVELHGSPMHSGHKEWRGISQNIRENIIMAILDLIAADRSIRLFASVIAKSATPNIDISGDLFTQVASRFDMFLGRIYKRNKNPQRGIAIFDKSTSELTIQRLSHIFTTTGHQWGKRLNNFAEVPLFLDSKMSRSIQMADLIAYSIFRHFEYKDSKYFSIIQNCFDTDGKDIHGLHMLV
ncbi:MAG: DUF3800 domain-containing protein [Treponema sp.]|jgi:hypothetical protein|nr:DUF3800 domain-containing protein [Treponema sp.]